jgi:hypothetical protein
MKQFEMKLQEVVQRQTPHGVGDRRLLGHNILHVSEALPGVGLRYHRPQPSFIHAQKGD